MLQLDRATGQLFDDDGRRFDGASRQWSPGGTLRGEILGPAAAARWLQRESGTPCRVPVGVIGPREASAAELHLAEEVGRKIAGLGATLLCGGKSGVMEAACRGATSIGGVAVGLLPDDHWSAANAYVSIPIATGIGVARNAIIARASLCLVAIGGGYGTLSEIAFGLQFGRPVFCLADAPPVPGIVALADTETLELRVARLMLALPG